MTENNSGALQALILAGGLSRRLGGVPKAGLVLEEQTLLARTVDAAARALAAHTATERAGTQLAAVPGETPTVGEATAQGAIAVVGPEEKLAQWLETAQARHRVVSVQEDPPFSGPAAGIAAGIGALAGDGGHVLVLACDMPQAGKVAAALLSELASCAPDQGVMAVAGGQKQPLAAIYPLAPLRVAANAARAAKRLENASVFALVASVNMKECAVPVGLSADIDTWADARAQGIAAGPAGAEGRQLENQDTLLQEWTRTLLEAFEIGDLEVDIHGVLNVAGVAAHSIVRPAAPLTTFIAGLAAGLAAGSGQTTEATAMKAALGLAKKLAAAQAPADDGTTAPAAAAAPEPAAETATPAGE